ncbi:hypothetical protein BMS3Bbin14_01989 [bacterium BMS3Bbin14]|nr:hypothetical protein BMS3Abin13_01860 [bacterium BMS3Abin13]GBE53495.1 hypothetical protein BMS3Bbin14_01989 [bacterium BMS3Bbin14]
MVNGYRYLRTGYIPPLIRLVAVALLVTGLPLLSVWLTGQPLARYLEFPPLTSYISHAPFSWAVFLLLAFFIVAVCAPFFFRIVTSLTNNLESATSSRPLPWWFFVGIGIILISWFLAWHRFSWFAPFQPYTFLPLWLGYIITVNALSYHRSGHCLLVNNRRFFLLLFPLSSLFWWFFEYLNRFVQNWHYLGTENFSPLGYVIHASLCFSTVLPAVLGTEELLATLPRLTEPLTDLWPVRLKNPVPCGWTVLIIAALGLAGIGIWPDYLFPLLWIAPLLVITGLQTVMGEKTIFSPLREGDWRPIWLPALAALVCGFFWEMWNSGSLAHWEYSIPFIQRFHIFYMPVLGYAGYLPFGLECAVMAALFLQGGNQTLESLINKDQKPDKSHCSSSPQPV